MQERREIRNSRGGKEEGLRASLSRTFCDNGIACILCRAPKIVALGHVVECGYCILCSLIFI